MTKKRRLVKVTWRDAEDPAFQDGKAWHSTEDIGEFAASHCIVTSVGYVMSQDKHCVILAADLIDEAAAYTGRVTKIPAGMTTSIVELVDRKRAKPKARRKRGA